MNKIKIWTLAVFVALGLTGCVQEDNSVDERLHTYDQTENFSSAAGTYTVELTFMTGVPVVGGETSDWATVTALPNSGEEPSKVEVVLKENTSGAERSMLQTIKIGAYTVKLTINQGITNVNDPNEEVTDQPAYSPDK